MCCTREPTRVGRAWQARYVVMTIGYDPMYALADLVLRRSFRPRHTAVLQSA